MRSSFCSLVSLLIQINPTVRGNTEKCEGAGSGEQRDERPDREEDRNQKEKEKESEQMSEEIDRREGARREMSHAVFKGQFESGCLKGGEVATSRLKEKGRR